MPSASIRSLVNAATPLVGVSRDDLVTGDIVTVESVNTHTTYSWTLAYRPVGSTAAFSGSVAAASPGTFTVDQEGPYLVRLTADLGLGTETTQYVRLRYLTVFGGLGLVAAGEGYGGAIPVPVDQTPTGWTDNLNTNITSILGFLSVISTSGRVFYVDPSPGYGDFQTVQAAVDAALVAGAASATPYVVLVRPGLYLEGVTFQPHVHVLGYPGSPAGKISSRVVVLRGVHSVPSVNASDEVVLANLVLENIAASADATLRKDGVGSLVLYRCGVVQSGLGAGQGPALLLAQGVATVDTCEVSMSPTATDDKAAITQPGALSSSLVIRRSTVTGPTGLVLNSSGGAGVLTEVTDTRVASSGATGVGIISDSESLLLEYVRVDATSGSGLQVHPGAGAFATGQAVTVRWSSLSGLLLFDTTGIVGATALSLGACDYAGLTFPGGSPATLAATVRATSLFYDNGASGLAASTVQDAIDEVMTIWNNVQTLDDAYDGGVPASGGGRTIIADAGSVQIVDAALPADPPPAGSTDGMLEVVGAVKVGALTFPEIDADPNPYGSGPAVLFGNRVVPNNIPFGTGTAIVMARSTGNPLFRNYNLRVQTQSSGGGGEIGRLVLQGGYGLANGGATPDGSSVYVLAGHAFDPAAVPGNVVLSPGNRTGGSPGIIRLVRPQGSTSATLTAAGVCNDPLGVTGDITFATDMGAVTVSLLAADTRAQVVAKLDSTPGISAAEAGGIITVTSDHVGETAEIYFLSASAGVDVAIGGFDGVAQVDGSFVEFIDVQVSADQEVSFGIGGASGPLIYNASTGKLTVPGLIDPTAVVFEQAAAPATGATEGAVFVSDGSGGLVAGHLYYRGPGSAVPRDLTP